MMRNLYYAFKAPPLIIFYIILQHHFLHGSCAEVTSAGITVSSSSAAQVSLVQLPPQFTNITVVNNTNAGTLCTPSLQVTDSAVVYDTATPGNYNNFHDYEVTTRANRSIFPTFGNELVITASDAAANNAFGNALALSGDGSVLAVGSTASAGLTASALGFGADTVYLYRRVRNSWVQIQEIQSPLISSLIVSGFGNSVALSYDGSILVIGAPGAPQPASGSPYSLGNVYIYTYSPTNNLWNLSQTIPGQLGFGAVVDISATGESIAIGSASMVSILITVPYNPSVFIYARQNTCIKTQNPWILQAQLIPTTNGVPFSTLPLGDDAFLLKYMALSADGTTVALGCPTNASTPASTLVLFQRSGSTWKQIQAIPAPTSSNTFGKSVALSAQGKYVATGEATNPNTLYIYAQRGTSWELETTFSSGTTFRTTSLAFSADGTVLVAGYYPASAGTLTLFLRGPNNRWNTIATFVGAASEDALGFACACSADGSIIAAGAPQPISDGAGYAVLLQSIGSTVPNDTVVSGSLCVYHRTTIDSNLKVAGNIHLQGTLVTGTAGHVTACTVPTSLPSDKRIKHTIIELDSQKALEIIRTLQPVHFSFNDSPEAMRKVGFIAQELERLLPGCVKTEMTADGRAIKMVYLHHEVYAYFISALQELQQRVERNREKISKALTYECDRSSPLIPSVSSKRKMY